MKFFARIAFVLLLVFFGTGTAFAVPLGLKKPLGAAKVIAVLDGDTVVLDDRRQVRLVGLQAPKLTLGHRDFKAWPLGAEARAELERMVLGRQVTLHAGGAEMDRHGRVLAHLVRDDGLWIQGAMLRAGMARVYSFPDNLAAVPELLSEETVARSARRGIWSDAFYAVRTPETVGAHVGGYELVEGRVMTAATVKARSYLNFGSDYRSDFTLTLNSAGRRALAKKKLKPQQFEGSVIRVRGWVSWENGPMIAISHPEQIEILEPSESLKAAQLKAETAKSRKLKTRKSKSGNSESKTAKLKTKKKSDKKKTGHKSAHKKQLKHDGDQT